MSSDIDEANAMIDDIIAKKEKLQNAEWMLSEVVEFCLSPDKTDSWSEEDKKKKYELASRLYWKLPSFRLSTINEMFNISNENDLLRYVIKPLDERFYCPYCEEYGTTKIENREHLKKIRKWATLDRPCDDCIKMGRRVGQLKAMPYKEYLQTEEWQKTRQLFLKKADNKCQLCNAEKQLHVHHRTYENLGEEGENDCIVLCRGCHAKFHDIPAVGATP